MGGGDSNGYTHILKLSHLNLINKKQVQPGPVGSRAGAGTEAAEAL